MHLSRETLAETAVSSGAIPVVGCLLLLRQQQPAAGGTMTMAGRATVMLHHRPRIGVRIWAARNYSPVSKYGNTVCPSLDDVPPA
ncbi:hypothetical protein R1flu_017426 [Riccia fluitans]|uniref:Secreted protein n=1 Tax=Riccia fluitans TaxID=41844 RepID=A0ABD1ZCY1_9MARC